MDLSRNYLFITDDLQAKIQTCRVLIIGVGLGSYIAEGLTRIGVRNLGICDGDYVDGSNLNRQNFTTLCISRLKSQSLRARLLDINPSMNIECMDYFLDENDMERLIPNYDFIVNTIDFDSPAFFSCHEICQRLGKVEFFPMNLGFGFGLVVFKDRYFDRSFSKEKIIDYVISNQKQSQYIKTKLEEYNHSTKEYDPQLIVGSMSNAAMICSVLCKMLDDKDVRTFPNFYFLDFASL